MKVNIKKLVPEAVIPQYAKQGDAGLDLVAIDWRAVPEYTEYSTGLSIEIPEGFVGLLFPRSSVSKYDLLMCDSVGVIDSGYRGEILCRFKRMNRSFNFLDIQYKVGDKICQLIIIPIPTIELVEVEELSDSVRGEGGFGSTGI